MREERRLEGARDHVCPLALGLGRGLDGLGVSLFDLGDQGAYEVGLGFDEGRAVGECGRGCECKGQCWGRDPWDVTVSCGRQSGGWDLDGRGLRGCLPWGL